MKASKTLLFAVLAATALTGCTNDEGEASVPDLAGTPIRIHTNLQERSLTRAGYDNTNLTEGNFGLFLTTTTDETNPRYNATNMPFSYDANSTAWTAVLAEGEEQLLWKNNSAPVSYYAYMPYQEEGITTDGDSYSLTVSVSDQSTADFLYYKHEGTVTATSGTTKPGAIDIEFQHQLSHLTVKLKRLDTTKDITFTAVTLQGCATSTTFNLTEGTLDHATETGGSISLLPAGTEDNTDGSKTDIYECILIPQNFQSITIFISGVDGAGNTKTYKYVSSSTELLESNTKYTLELNVGNNYVTAGTVSVSEWDTESGWTIEGEADEWTGPDASIHTIKTSKAGQIADNPDWIGTAIGTGTSLTIVGPMDATDFTTIKNYLKSLSGTIIDLDLSDAGLTSIPAGNLSGNGITSLGAVALPKVLESIGTDALRECPSLQITNWGELTVLKTIGGSAFIRSSGLSGDIEIPEGVTSIGTSAFATTGITSIVFPSTVTTISDGIFTNCSSLQTVTFRGNIASVGQLAFSSCTNLRQIDFSACEGVPEVTGSRDVFNNITPGDITILVKDEEQVKAFEAKEPWNQCIVKVVSEGGDNLTD